MTVQTVRKNTLPQLYLVNQNMSTCMKAFRFFSTDYFNLKRIEFFYKNIFHKHSNIEVFIGFLYVLSPFFAY